MYNTKLEEKKIGDWSNVVDLVDFAIVKHAPKSLLGTAMADVLLKYKRKSNQKLEDVKSLHLYGPEEIVYKRALEIIDRKKNKMHSSQLRQRFIHEFQTSKFRSNAENFGEPGTLLGRAIYDTGASTRAFAEKYKIKAATLYHHVRGGPNGRVLLVSLFSSGQHSGAKVANRCDWAQDMLVPTLFWMSENPATSLL